MVGKTPACLEDLAKKLPCPWLFRIVDDVLGQADFMNDALMKEGDPKAAVLKSGC